MSDLAQQLAQLSADEMVSALGVREGPRWLRAGLSLPFRGLSRSLGRTLARMDRRVTEVGLPEAAGGALADFGVSLRVSGAAPETGPCLVLANHPGAYDALALMRALGRNDLVILAADRTFLRALPHLSERLAFAGAQPAERASALRRTIEALREGRAVLHFPAGCIEPDAEFEPYARARLAPWQPGVKALLRAARKYGAELVVAGVRGVHSPRAKGWALNRWAEARGVTTLCPLLQLALSLRDVTTRVHLEVVDADDDEDALRERLRAAVVAFAEQASPKQQSSFAPAR
jgi:1-acyl-sn-glycerol-3-phosphate acyltransferase